MQGTAALHVVIATNGSVRQNSVPSDPVLLVQSAVKAVKYWRYQPFLLNGNAVAADTQAGVIFSLP